MSDEAPQSFTAIVEEERRMHARLRKARAWADAHLAEATERAGVILAEAEARAAAEAPPPNDSAPPQVSPPSLSAEARARAVAAMVACVVGEEA